MSSKYVTMCDICGKQINEMTEMYESYDDNSLGFDDKGDMCESCTIRIKNAIHKTIYEIKNPVLEF